MTGFGGSAMMEERIVGRFDFAATGEGEGKGNEKPAHRKTARRQDAGATK